MKPPLRLAPFAVVAVLCAARVLADPSPAYLVKDINKQAGVAATVSHRFIVSSDTAWFGADSAETGEELWKTDGTNAGTVRVKDVHPGPGDGVPTSFTLRFGTALVFGGDDGATGPELWASDGTAANTHLVANIGAAGGSHPDLDDIAEAGGLLFFAATTNEVGRELFAVPISALMDGDADGLDFAAETTHGTNPFDADSDDDGLTDGDGFSDGVEIADGTNPLDPNDPPAIPLASPWALATLAALLLASATEMRRRA